MVKNVKSKFGNLFRNLRGFSLVELIIVIAIIAILSVAGFLTLQKRISQSRDSKRLGDLETIEKSLTVNYTDQDTPELYPKPDENNDGSEVTTGTIDGETVAYKGTFGSGAIENMDNLNEVPVDPLDDHRYVYGVTEDQQNFQISAVLENGEKISYNLTDRAYAADKKSTVRGNYDGLMVYTSGSSNYISNIPSLIFNGTGNLSNTGAVSYVVDGSSNLAYGEDTTQKEKFEEVVRKTYGLSEGVTISFVNTGTNSLKQAIEDGKLSEKMKNSLGGNEGVIKSKLEESGVSIQIEESSSEWSGDGTSSSPFVYNDSNGNVKHPQSCNDIISGNTVYEAANISSSVTYSGGSSSKFKNGVYKIDPNGDGSGFEIYCDMDIAGGPYMLVGSYNYKKTSSFVKSSIIKPTDTDNILTGSLWSEIRDNSTYIMLTSNNEPGYVRAPIDKAKQANCQNLTTLKPRIRDGKQFYAYTDNGCDGVNVDYCYIANKPGGPQIDSYNYCSTSYTQYSSDGNSRTTGSSPHHFSAASSYRVWLMAK